MKRILFWCGLGFILGILLFSLPMRECYLVLAGIFPCGFLLHKSSKSSISLFIALYGSLCLGVFCAHFYQYEEQQAYQMIQSSSEGLTVRVGSQNGSGFQAEVSGGIWFSYSVMIYPEEDKSEYIPGQILYLKGEFVEYTHEENDGGFDAKDYYRRKGILGKVLAYEITVIKDATVWNRCIRKLKKYIYNTFLRLLPSDEAGFLYALFSADRSQMSDAMKQLFQTFGLAHLLTISGMHISFLAGIVRSVLRVKLRKKYADLVSVFFLLQFGLLCGFSVSIIRVLGCFLVYSLAGFLRRKKDEPTTLMFVLCCVLLRRPCGIYDTSVLLSYGAGAFFYLILPACTRIQKEERGAIRISCDEKMHPIRTVLLLQLFFLPILLCMNYSFSPYTILLNLIILPLFPLFLVFGLGMIVLFPIYSPLAALMGFGVRFMYRGLLFLLETIRTFPAKTIVTGMPGVIGILLFYIIFGILVLRNHFSGYERCRTVIMLLAVGMLFYRNAPSGIYNLSVGQGDCSVILYERKAFVLDCGSTDRDSVGKDILLNFLYYHGISEIETVILSHPDKDHYSGLSEIAEEIDIHHFYCYLLPDDPALTSLYDDVGEVLSYGDRLHFHDLTLTCVWPRKDAGDFKEEEDSNDQSLVIYLCLGEFNGLFTGDIDGDTMEEIADSLDVSIDYLKEIGRAHV